MEPTPALPAQSRLWAQQTPTTTSATVLPWMAKISVSLDDELLRSVRAAAGPDGVSAWLAGAAASRLRSEAIFAVAEEIAQATGGPYTTEELIEAQSWLPSSSTPAR